MAGRVKCKNGEVQLSTPQPSSMSLSGLGWGLLAFMEQSPGSVLMNVCRREREGGPRNLPAVPRSPGARLQWAGTWPVLETRRLFPHSHTSRPAELCRRGWCHFYRSANLAASRIVGKRVSLQIVPPTRLAGPSPTLSFELLSRLT